MIELEEERRGLEMQVHRMEEDLSNFRLQLRGATVPTQVPVPEFASVHSALQELAADWRAAQQLHEEVFREVSEMPEEGQVDEASQNSGEQAVSSYGEELESVRSAAEALLERLRSAVLRAPTSSVEVFRELASESGGRLNSSMLARLLSKFEPSVPVAVVDAAFGRLDQEGKGYVEENDWLLGLNLPRLGATDPRRT